LPYFFVTSLFEDVHFLYPKEGTDPWENKLVDSHFKRLNLKTVVICAYLFTQKYIFISEPKAGDWGPFRGYKLLISSTLSEFVPDQLR
jgi:hypothetical protein